MEVIKQFEQAMPIRTATPVRSTPSACPTESATGPVKSADTWPPTICVMSTVKR